MNFIKNNIFIKLLKNKMFSIFQNILFNIKQIKWRKLNKHNYTAMGTIFRFDNVIVGKMSYGILLVADASYKKTKLKIGAYCSIGGE